MSKAILVIDMPRTCEECPICQGVALDGDYVCSIKDEHGEERGFDDGRYEKPDWCPLKPVPEKKKEKTLNDIVGVGDRESVFKCVLEELVKQGYNACIDEILKGGAEE